MYNYENNNDEAKKEEALNEGEFQMVRSRYEQLDEDRSAIPPPNQKEESKLLKLIKKNKLVFAVILTLFVALTLSIVLLCVYSANSSDKALTGNYTFVFGTEEIKYKNSKVTNDKSEHKRYCNALKQGLGFTLSLVQVLSTIIT